MANVLFFLTGTDAEEEGFRPCLRCKPEEGEDPAERRQKEAVGRAKEVIEARVKAGGKIGLEELSREVSVSAFHLHRCFKREVGVTPEGYAKQLKKGMGTESRKGVRG